MHLRQAMRLMQANAIAGNATTLLSDPGIGKTDTFFAFAKWYLGYCKTRNSNAHVGIAVTFIPTASPISATGLPWKSEKTWQNPITGEPVTYTVTDPAIPTWYMAVDLETGEVRPASTFDQVVLGLEEWGQGSAEAKRSFAEVYLKGGVGGYYLPQGSPRIALANLDARDGVTKEFDHVINRGSRNVVNFDYQVWHDDFADRPYMWQGREWQMASFSKAWAATNPALVCEPKPKQQGPWCTPRSFTAQDRYVQSIMELCGGTIPLDDTDFIEGCAGHCGMAQTQSYINTLRFRVDLPSLETIVKDPEDTPVPVKADLQMLLIYELAGRVQREHLGPVIKYITKRKNDKGMPPDMHITFVKSVMRRNAKEFLNHPAMMDWLAKNAYLVSIIGSLS